MFTAAIFLPLLGAIIAGLLGRWIGARGAQWVTCILLVVSALLSVWIFIDVALGGNTRTVELFTWIDSGDLEVSWALYFDTLTAVMVSVVTIVSAVVHIYSVGYMHEDPHKARFFSYLSLFTFAMLMLVTADNLLQMFFGWEGVGVCSYLLIGFWYHKPEANAAAIKAFLVNRIGDFGFALGIVGTFLVFDSILYETIFAGVPGKTGAAFEFLGMQVDIMTTLAILLFIGAMGKSAQLGLHTWLPDAMEGPTPVSALIHAATMVTAGVFMVCRLSPMFEAAPIALNMVAIVGASTAIFAATVALTQNDIKRVIAYSTCSQLGYMFFAAGVGAYPVAIFHLMTHAFFKALLFLGSGMVIHAMHHEQDMRKMGGIWKKIPITYVFMWVGSLALAGVPIFAGYYSKDMVLESAFGAHTPVGMYAFWLGIGAALLTAFYSWRLIYMTFHGQFRGDPHTMEHLEHASAMEREPVAMWAPLLILFAGAILAGLLAYPLFVGDGMMAFWGKSFPPRIAEVIEAAHHTPAWVKLSPLVVGAVGILLATLFYLVAARADIPGRIARAVPWLYNFSLNKWYFDELYDAVFVRPAKRIGYFLWKKGDNATIDGFGPDGVSAAVKRAARRVAGLQTGYVYHYAFAIMIGVAAIVSWYIFERAV